MSVSMWETPRREMMEFNSNRDNDYGVWCGGLDSDFAARTWGNSSRSSLPSQAARVPRDRNRHCKPLALLEGLSLDSLSQSSLPSSAESSAESSPENHRSSPPWKPLSVGYERVSSGGFFRRFCVLLYTAFIIGFFFFN